VAVQFERLHPGAAAQVADPSLLMIDTSDPSFELPHGSLRGGGPAPYGGVGQGAGFGVHAPFGRGAEAEKASLQGVRFGTFTPGWQTLLEHA